MPRSILRLYEHLGERDKALADYRAALEIAPDYKDPQEGVRRLANN
jgi:tetratricopeptide (TPR) repeat protein